MKTREIIEREMNREQVDANFFSRVCFILKKWQGKQIGKRLLNHVKANFSTDTRISLRDVAGMTYLDLWDGETGRAKYDEKYSFFVHYHSEGNTFSLAKFEGHNPAFGDAAQARNQERLTILSSDLPEKLDVKIAAFKQAGLELKETIGNWNNIPDYFSIMTENHVPDKLFSELFQ